jgi:sugar/nucleoside kinase (ribokinase family)
LLQNWDLKRVGSFANACAALCCTKVGARAMSKYNEVATFIDRNQAKSGAA